GNAPPKVLRKDHASVHPAQDTRGGKSLTAIGLGPKPPSHTSVRQSVSNPDPLSYAEPQLIPDQDVAQSSRIAAVVADPDSKNTSFTSMAGSPGSIYQPGIQARENEIKNLEALLEAEADMKKAAEAKNAKLVEELEGLPAQFSDLQVSNVQLSQQVSTLQAQITSEEKIKAAFEEFKKYEDERVNYRCAEMDARLDKLSVDFNEEL
ncbi:hypothetical protein Tco_0611056, partial [Tanacetum coccineum]